MVKIDRLVVEFARNRVLREISLEVPRGETLAIIGESGCGKTVLLKTIIGLLRPTRGHVRFDGKDDRMSRGLKEKLIGDSTVVIAFKLNELGQGSRCALFASSLQTGPATFQITVDGKNPGTVGIVSRLERRMPIAAATTDFTIIVVRRRGSELVGRSGGKLTATLALKAKEMEKVSHVILGTNRAKNSWLSCDIAEVLVYGRALSDAEIVSVEDYLSKKYAIPLTGR